jgi:hypothetical protein
LHHYACKAKRWVMVCDSVSERNVGRSLFMFVVHRYYKCTICCLESLLDHDAHLQQT